MFRDERENYQKILRREKVIEYRHSGHKKMILVSISFFLMMFNGGVVAL